MVRLNKILLLLILLSSGAFAQIWTNNSPGIYGKSFQPAHDPPEIINKYAPVLLLNICSNEITISDSSAFKVGDTVLLIQVKGALTDTSNTPAYGNVVDYKNAGKRLCQKYDG